MNLSEQLKQGRTLPGNWYTDLDIFKLEKKNIFEKMWNYAGPAHQLVNPGDYLTCTVAGHIPVIVVRNDSGELNAFINVCRHRGSRMVSCDHGQRKSIQCQYHAWTWNLDGELQAAPSTGDNPCFAKQDYPLHKIAVTEWGPFVFVNLNPNPMPFEEMIAGLPEAIAETSISLSNLKHHQQLRYDINANWKLTVENYLECYHCPIAHPQLVKIVRMDDYTVYPDKYFSVQKCSLKGDPKDLLRGAGSFVWPSFTVNIYPGIINISSTIYEPISPNKTRAVYDVYFPEGVSDTDKKSVVDFLDQVQKEDTALCEAVQLGCESGYYSQGHLVLAKENGVQHFQRLVHEAL